MKISEIITDKYKLRIDPNVYYDLLADVREAEEEQEPCEPVRNPDQLDCISRKAVLDAINTDFHEDLSQLEDAVKQLPPVNPQKPKSEWQQDHEILKAYSDGANDVLDKIRNEVCDIDDEIVLNPDSFYERKVYVRFYKVIDIIDKYKAEGSSET